MLKLFTEAFSEVQENKMTMEEDREVIHSELSSKDADSFSIEGSKGTDIVRLLEALLHEDQEYWSCQYCCVRCE